MSRVYSMDATVINFAKTCSLESVLFRLYKSFYINYANILFACFACSVINGFYFKSLNFVPIIPISSTVLMSTHSKKEKVTHQNKKWCCLVKKIIDYCRTLVHRCKLLTLKKNEKWQWRSQKFIKRNTILKQSNTNL